MAIDHYAVPAIYLLDLARLLPAPEDVIAASELASAWRCWRPLATATVLAASLLRDWASHAGVPFDEAPSVSRRIVASYGTQARLPRPEQLLRKLLHFDTPQHALRYFVVQSRRNVLEALERHIRHRSPRERLALAERP
jgi:hypothetical protein